jgi:two-component system NtrC family sensor kinase
VLTSQAYVIKLCPLLIFRTPCSLKQSGEGENLRVIRDAKFIGIIISTALLAIGVANLYKRLSENSVADDGVHWSDTDAGVRAEYINPNSPLAQVIKKGDHLRYLLYRNKYESIESAESVHRYLNELGAGGQVCYLIERSGGSFDGASTANYEISFEIASSHGNAGVELYLALIGLVYLAAGLLILFTHGEPSLTSNLFAWFEVAFVVHLYGPTQQLTAFDNLTDFLYRAALALLAPLFLRFCAKFPLQRLPARSCTSQASPCAIKPLRSLAIAVASYALAAELIVAEAVYHFAPGIFDSFTLARLRNWLDAIELLQCALFFVIGCTLLLRSFVKARDYLIRSQLEWMIWGLALAVAPFAALQLVTHLTSASLAQTLESLSYGPLILIPLCIGYAMIRYRLSDVDLSLRPVFIHLAATAAVVAIYFLLIIGISGFIWPTVFTQVRAWPLIVAGMLVMALLLIPVKEHIKRWSDSRFYGERYTLRKEIHDFGRALTQVAELSQVLDIASRRLSEMLSVDKVAIFIEDPESRSGFRLASARRVYGDIRLPDDITELMRRHSNYHGFISALDLSDARRLDERLDARLDESLADGICPLRGAEAEIYYYLPCYVRERMIACIAIGRQASGMLLTGEDMELLATLSDYLAIAIQNCLLYQSQTEQIKNLAREVELATQLKQLSESIIDSLEVGILVVGADERILVWNKSTERMFAVARQQAIGHRLDETLDHELAEVLRSAIKRKNQVQVDCNLSRDLAREGCQLAFHISPLETAHEMNNTLVIITETTKPVAQPVQKELSAPEFESVSMYARMLLEEIAGDFHRVYTRSPQIIGDLDHTQFYEVDINHLLGESLRLLDRWLRGAGVEVVCRYGQGLPPVYGNPFELQQVFIMLMLSARDSMAEGGQLTIQTRLVGTSLVIDLRDSGGGLLLEDIARIQDPLIYGADLGLMLCYRIIQRHGGRIFAEGQPGKGAHFAIKLPTASAGQAVGQREPHSFFRRYSPHPKPHERTSSGN